MLNITINYNKRNIQHDKNIFVRRLSLRKLFSAFMTATFYIKFVEYSCTSDFMYAYDLTRLENCPIS